MEKLSVHYGVMGAAKTSNLLLEARNYKIGKNKDVIILKPIIDTRELNVLGFENGCKVGEIKSRVDIESEKCYLIEDETNVYNFVKELSKNRNIECVFVDEHQFLNVEQVKQLSDIVDKLSIDVKTYGLLSQYIEGQIFDAVQSLLFYADEVHEIQTSCKYCKRKATHNLKLSNNKPVYTGEEVVIEDVNDISPDRYEAVCRKHYKEPLL